MATSGIPRQVRCLGLALLTATLFAGGCETSSAVGPQPVVRESPSQLETLERINSLETELSALRNTVEIQQNEIARLTERLSEVHDDIDRRLRMVEGGAPAYGGAPGYAPPAPGIAPTTPIAPGGTTPATGAVVATDAVTQTAPAASADEQRQYDAAFDLLKQSRYEEAVTAFREFLDRYPGSPLADSAQYWIAEARYVTNAYDAALHEYNVLIQRYPASPKLPDAMLKVGYIHYDNQQWAEARRALNAVVKRYPGSRVAVSAQMRLDQMEKEGH